MNATKDNLKKMSFADIKDSLFYEPITIGRTWEKRRSVCIGPLCEDDAKTGNVKIKVIGKPRRGNYLFFEEFPYNDEGFESAKKSALGQ